MAKKKVISMVVDVYSANGVGSPIAALNGKPSPQRNIRVNSEEFRKIVACGAYIRTPDAKIVTITNSEDYIYENFQ